MWRRALHEEILASKQLQVVSKTPHIEMNIFTNAVFSLTN